MGFAGERLRLLRRFFNLTQRELGQRVGSPASAINAYERGLREPKGLVLDALGAALQARPAFFFSSVRDDEFQENETNFRSLVSTPERVRRHVLAHTTLFGVLLEYLGTVIKLPTPKFPAISITGPDDIEHAAEACRVEWGVGVDAPIANVTHMMELAGVVITTIHTDVGNKVDAFSRYGRTNLIVLNPAKGSATRLRMDVVHEAGHGALHRGGQPSSIPEREEQAKQFGSALLMPRAAFAREFWSLGRSRSWEQLFALKARWGASVSAIVVRSFQLGLIDAAEYRRRYKYIAKSGWLRGNEPSEPLREEPQWFTLAFDKFQSTTGKSAKTIADELGWTPDLFTSISGIDASPVENANVTSFAEFRQRRFSVS